MTSDPTQTTIVAAMQVEADETAALLGGALRLLRLAAGSRCPNTARVACAGIVALMEAGSNEQ